jgi:hypothetical protein
VAIVASLAVLLSGCSELYSLLFAPSDKEIASHCGVTEAELNRIATGCGLALGQLAQDEEEKRLLFVMEAKPSMAKQKCVRQWARRNHLKTVVIGDVEWTTQ